MLVSNAIIRKLLMCTRKSVHEHMRRGSFGPVIEHDGMLFAQLAGVERHVGQRFTPSQIEAAIDGKPGRFLTIAQSEEAA